MEDLSTDISDSSLIRTNNLEFLNNCEQVNLSILISFPFFLPFFFFFWLKGLVEDKSPFENFSCEIRCR